MAIHALGGKYIFNYYFIPSYYINLEYIKLNFDIIIYYNI